ncbi:MAG TPA: glutamine synthetase family protein [Acidimicrobiales bacterium]
MERDELARWLDDNDVEIVRIDATGVEGTLLGKHVARRKFESCLPSGVALNDIGLAMDLGGTPQLGWWGDWRQDALGDALLRPDLSTLTAVAHEPGIAWCTADITGVDGVPLPVCPRSLLARQQADLDALGYSVRAAFELEFFVFEDRIDAARRKGFRNLTPLGGAAPKQSYMTQRSPEFVPLLRELSLSLERAGVPWEAFSDEAGPGQFELNIAPGDAVTAADRAARAKQILREVAYAHGKSVTFMARPFPEMPYGNGLHVHVSLWRGDEPAFADPRVLRHWVAGCMATVAGMTSIATPTVNSFRRQVDFVAAPTTPTWGEENKAAAVRTVTRTGALARMEHRVAAGDANPYLVLAGVLAGGISGLVEELEPPEPVAGLPWGLPEDHPRLPHSLTTAAAALAADTRLRARLGDAFIEHWTESRKFEWLMFHTGGGDPDATGSTDWELARYFEWV